MSNLQDIIWTFQREHPDETWDSIARRCGVSESLIIKVAHANYRPRFSRAVAIRHALRYANEPLRPEHE